MCEERLLTIMRNIYKMLEVNHIGRLIGLNKIDKAIRVSQEIVNRK
jgi:hypothetical protein